MLRTAGAYRGGNLGHRRNRMPKVLGLVSARQHLVTDTRARGVLNGGLLQTRPKLYLHALRCTCDVVWLLHTLPRQP